MVMRFLVVCRLHRVRGLALGFGSWDPKDASASSEERQQRFNAVGLEADILVEVPHGCNNLLHHRSEQLRLCNNLRTVLRLRVRVPRL